MWGHHLFVAGQSTYAGLVFSILSFLVAIPSAIKVFNWTATIYKGSVSLESPMLYALGFIGLFTIGGLTGLFLAAMGLDIHVHDTYFVVAHFHYIMVGGAIMGYLGGLHYWWPKISGRLYSEAWAKFSALLVFVGFNLTFFPQFIAGYLGMPRRYHAYPPEFQVLNVLSTAGASILAVGYLLPLIYFTYSLVTGEKAANDPWGARGLEWEIPSPPPTENFTVTPVVTAGTHQVRPEPGGRHCLTHAEHFPGPIHQPPLVANVDAIQPGVHTSTRTIRSCSTTSMTWSSRSRPPGSACGCSWSPKSCSSAACSWPTSSTARRRRKRSRKPATISTSRWGAFNTAVLICQLADDGAGGARGTDQPAAERQVGWLLATMVLGRSSSA